ncbi:MAG: hypothetical protein ACUVRF_11305, partial [Desulfotomaculales bacterium]
VSRVICVMFCHNRRRRQPQYGRVNLPPQAKRFVSPASHIRQELPEAFDTVRAPEAMRAGRIESNRAKRAAKQKSCRKQGS